MTVFNFQLTASETQDFKDRPEWRETYARRACSKARERGADTFRLVAHDETILAELRVWDEAQEERMFRAYKLMLYADHPEIERIEEIYREHFEAAEREIARFRETGEMEPGHDGNTLN